ncbi:alpha/beta hydrolase family protein [Glaciecola sp. 2405UD65-10]|uniref:alpha/beta hydrolase family protein n=1 Tax=Glaciecola sp. 2405UD65-10 TaxID=3397244 RepID=UPI003B5AB54B
MRALLLTILLVCVSPFLYSQAQQLPFSTYGNLESKSMYAVSPSGKYVAFRQTDAKSKRDLVLVVDALTGELINGVDVAEVNPNELYFVAEDKLIMVVTQNKKIGGYDGRHEISFAFAFNVSTSSLFQMMAAKGEKLTPGQTRLGTVLGISHDKKYAFMPAYDTDGDYNLYRVRLDKRSSPRIHKRGTRDTIDFFVGANDELIARESYNNKSNKHSIQSYLSGKWVDVFEQTTDYITTGFVGIAADQKSLVMSKTGENGLRAYYSLSLIDGSISEPLFSNEQKTVESPITDINRVVHGAQYAGFKPTYEFFEPKLNARLRGLAKALPEFTSRIVDYTDDWENIIFYADGENNAGSYLMYKAGALSILAKTRPNIPVDGIANVKIHEYKARDGVLIPTLLTYPKNIEAKNLPAIMMPHGGPESYDKMHFDYLAQYFANRGYLVIQPQFRGSTGFGARHTLIGRGEWGRKMQDDLSDGVEHLASMGVIDPSKVCIVGASYGGYAALAGAVFTPDLYKCVIAINGVFDLPQMLRSERASYGRNHWVIAYWDDVMAGGKFDKDHLNAISPINHASKVKAPVLLVHSSYDKVVPWQQSDDMFDELEDAEKDVTFVKLEKGDHSLSSAETRLKAMQAIDTFMQKHM